MPLTIWWLKTMICFFSYSQILGFMFRSNFWICWKERKKKSKVFFIFFCLFPGWKINVSTIIVVYSLLLSDYDAVYCSRLCLLWNKYVSVIVPNGDKNLVIEWMKMNYFAEKIIDSARNSIRTHSFCKRIEFILLLLLQFLTHCTQ